MEACGGYVPCSMFLVRLAVIAFLTWFYPLFYSGGTEAFLWISR